MQKVDDDIQDLLADGVDPETEFRKLKEEEAYRLENEKFHFYEPNGKCEQFINAVGKGDNFIVLFSAANGVGKTAAGANVVSNIVFPSENAYFNAKLFKDFPFPKRGRIASDPKNVDNIVNSLKEWLPAGKFHSKKGGKSYDSDWWVGDEKSPDWWWDIMTYEQDPKEFEGETLGWAWFDEPPPQAIFTATVARMRKGGIIFITATPLTGSGWMFDSFLSGNYDAPGLKEGETIKRSVAYIEADVEDACIDHGVRGHLEHDNIMRMVAEYSEDERQARVHGKFQHLVGLIFKQWNRQIHIVKPFLVNLREYVVYEMLDPHPRNPDAVMWVAINRKGQKFVVDELFLKCANGTEELAQRIKEKASNYRIIRRLADPSAFIEDQHSQKSVATRLSSFGLNYLEASKARSASDKRIQDALSFSQLPTGEFIKAPEIYVFDTCHRTIWEIEHYRWDEWTGRSAEKKNAKEKPVDKDDHMVENLGRCLIQEPLFVEMSISRSDGSGTIGGNDDPFA